MSPESIEEVLQDNEENSDHKNFYFKITNKKIIDNICE